MKHLVRTTVVALSSLPVFAWAQAAEWRVTPSAWTAGFDGTLGVPGTGSGLIGRVDIDMGSLTDNLRLIGASFPS